MNNWKDRIAKAKTIETPVPIVPTGYKLEGYWRKGYKDSSWVAVLTGLSQQYGFERDFVANYDMKWMGEKGKGEPQGMKMWSLPDGLYSLQIAGAPRLPARRFFAAVDGDTLTELSEEQVRSIFEDGAALPPPPPRVKASAPVGADPEEELNDEPEVS